MSIEQPKPLMEEVKEENFECLDRGFFQSEFEKVLFHIQTAQKEVRFRFGSYTDKGRETNKKLQELRIAVLDELEFIQHSFEPIDPKYELRALQRSSEVIEACKRGEIIEISIEDQATPLFEPPSIDEGSFPSISVFEEANVGSLIDELESVSHKKKQKSKKQRKVQRIQW